MRIQPIVLSCQAENVPTLSSIPIWIDQLRRVLTVYAEDDKLMRTFKKLTEEVCFQ
jgi:hypothetical protein